jgi:hypothetical protein
MTIVVKIGLYTIYSLPWCHYESFHSGSHGREMTVWRSFYHLSGQLSSMLTTLNTLPSIMAVITAGSRLTGNGLFVMRQNFHRQRPVHVPVRYRIGEQV